MDLKKLVIALDYPHTRFARKVLSELDPNRCRIKVGKEMFTRFGPTWVEEIQAAGFDVFLDLKFHDIPNTVRAATRAAADLGVWMLNIHALGGRAMMEAAKEGILSSNHQPKLIAVTLLTSLSEADLPDIGIEGPIDERAARLAVLAKECGADGVVCSAQEVVGVKQACGVSFLTVCPGIQVDTLDKTDQKRVMSPERALQCGSDYLVIGRCITQAADPMAVVTFVNKTIQNLCG